MRDVSPRLVIDLHEHNGDDFWMSARHQVHDHPGARRQVQSGGLFVSSQLTVFARLQVQSGPDRVLSVHAEDENWEVRMAQAVSEAVSASGVPLHKTRTGNGGGKSFFHHLGPGVFWLDAGQRGEGLNLADYGADRYGNAFTVETGMFLPFESRVATAKLVVQTLLDVFASRYA